MLEVCDLETKDIGELIGYLYNKYDFYQVDIQRVSLLTSFSIFTVRDKRNEIVFSGGLKTFKQFLQDKKSVLYIDTNDFSTRDDVSDLLKGDDIYIITNRTAKYINENKSSIKFAYLKELI